MERLLDVERKRQLCSKIAESYREKAKEVRIFGNKIVPPKCENLFFPPFIGEIVGDILEINHSNTAYHLEKESRKYDDLANSRFRIYFKPVSSLQKTLNKILNLTV